jgi:hypothetical protein
METGFELFEKGKHAVCCHLRKLHNKKQNEEMSSGF